MPVASYEVTEVRTLIISFPKNKMCNTKISGLELLLNSVLDLLP